MAQKKTQAVDDLEVLRDISDDVEESEFVPYASLYNGHTVITKNGELLQTIRVTGLSYENIRQESMELRRTLREVIRATLPNDAFALWFHTVRLEHDLSTPGTPEVEFGAELNGAWIEKNRFKKQYTNEVYITVVHEGQDASILSSRVFMRGLIPRLDLRWRNGYIEGIYEKLNTVVSAIEEKLSSFGAARLGLVMHDGVYHSDLLRFLNKIINFIDTPVPVAQVDLSNQLTSGDITFGYNAMEVRSATGRRRFATILTLKEYKEKALPYIDRFLKLPMEFIVTQCVSFVDPKQALESYKKQKEAAEIGEEKDLSRLSELDDILASDSGKITDFGEQQLSVFIISDNVRQLERNVRHAITFLSRHGVVAIREDLKFEECYWAQLPGNFEFVARMHPTPSQHMAGFANLYNHPVGLLEDNHWGTAVTTFHTANGAPYFFNFHVGANGHTVIVGQPGTGKATLKNFLLAQAMKFHPKIFYFDAANRHLGFVGKLGGESHVFSPVNDGPPVMLNPFSLAATEGNARFLTRWLTVLLRCAGQGITDEDKEAIASGLEAIYGQATAPAENTSVFAAEPKPRTMSRLIAEMHKAGHAATAAKFALWCEGGAYGHLFDHEEDVLDGPERVHGLHLAEALKDPVLAPALLSYLMQKTTTALDGSPGIFALDEGWQLIGQTHVAADLAAWLSHLEARNAIAIFSTSAIEDAGTKPFTPVLMEKAATQIYFPDADPDEVYMEGFGLSELEFSYLDVIEVAQHHFLLKRMENTIIAEFNMSGLDSLIDVLAGDDPAPARRAA